MQDFTQNIPQFTTLAEKWAKELSNLKANFLSVLLKSNLSISKSTFIELVNGQLKEEEGEESKSKPVK